jgi:hypothetical protein
MKIQQTFLLIAVLSWARLGVAQDVAKPRVASATGQYATDIATVDDAQKDALEQAREMLKQTENPTQRAALQTAIKEMERAETSLQAAQKNSADIPAAVVAEQAAYQALLKLVPHEFRVSKSRRASRGGGAGQPNQRQMDELEMTSEENRYETERQATAAPTPQQRQQLEMADRLKELAQRQQDLNDRLRELQTALQQAKTEKEQEEIKRELKHLADEERQMLSDVDSLRQKADQSPSSDAMTQAGKDLEQTRAQTQQAAQELGEQSVSQALAAGTRAQQSMQNLRENLRSQTSSQFSSQMRQLQNQARDLAKQEDDIAQKISALDDHKALENSEASQQLAQQIVKQQSALTNLLGHMQDITEKAESSEPLLSEQLYDTLRRAGQMHTESMLRAESELMQRGFLAKAAEVESSARTNINELRQRIEHAADSVLGSQSESLRYAQAELSDLQNRVQRDLGGAETNSTAGVGSGTNSSVSAQPGSGGAQTNLAGGEVQDVLQRLAARRQAEQSGSAQPGQGDPTSDAKANASSPGKQAGSGNAGGDRLRELVQQSGGNDRTATAAAGGDASILGGGFANWADRMRDVEQVVDSTELRNRLATVRERVAGFRAEYRLRAQKPTEEEVRVQVLNPLAEIRQQLLEDLARLQNAHSLVPLDHDAVPDNYSELVRKYYEKLGGSQ